MKSVGGIVLYIILLSLAMLAIFDTQVLSIFRRQKEIGTYIALGMTRGQVVGLFTIEGSLNSVLAGLLAALYGIHSLPSRLNRECQYPEPAKITDWLWQTEFSRFTALDLLSQPLFS